MENITMPRVLGELLADRVGKNSQKVFLQFKDQNITYKEIDLFSNRCANGFQKLGINKGDKVSIMLKNCPEFIYAWFGLAKLGAVEVPVNTNYKGEFLRHIVDQSDSTILLVGSEYLGRVKLIQDSLGKLTRIIVMGQVKTEEADGLRIPTTSFEEFFAGPDSPVDVAVYPSDPLSIIYTSGTTGVSKGALGCHNFWMVVTEKMLDHRDGKKDDVFLTFLPLYHFNAQVLTTLTALVAGARMVLMDNFSASRFWDDVRHYGATQFNYLGAVMPILAKQPEKPNDADNPARIALGAGCPPAVMEEVEKRFGIKCLEGFGMTEIGIPIHVRVDDRRKGSCGKAMDIYEMKLFDDNDVEVAVDEIGEIVFRPRESYLMMSEYYKMPDKTVEAYRNLWFHTGDLAKKDSDGYFYFVDRKKDALRRRGENISSFEVERAINTHPKVLESAAVAVQSELAEDEVKICIVLKPGETLSPEELIAYSIDRMPYFAVPRFVEFMDGLPKTPTERTQKYLLKQAGVTPTTWDREKAGIKVAR
ncbi:MAG: ATP-dependent acyl-CoA ligase [Syntrophobacteraceae bacterium]|nr:ATP-dependent acyl-CoA ligase [Syntrophobacteraceae bacterium]